MTANTGAHAAQPWTQQLLHSRWLDGHALSFFLEELNPLWSLVEPRGRILDIIEETHDTKSFVLSPGWGWRRFKPGQHIGVAVEIDGRLYRRRYSISSAAVRHARDPITITVKRERGGRISNHLHDQARVGEVLRLALPAGDFVLPSAAPDKLLLLAAGSGITPIMAQLRALLAGGHAGRISLLHYVRSAADRIFGAELEALARQHPHLTVHWCLEEGMTEPQRFSPAQIAMLVPDYASHHTMLCGPAGFMAAVRGHWDELGLNARLQFEYFGSVPDLRPAPSAAGTRGIHLAGRQRELRAGPEQNLLQALEGAGESPAYGCRQGICQSCKCRKLSGTVRNLVTGALSREPEEEIQLCISAAESDLVLDY